MSWSQYSRGHFKRKVLAERQNEDNSTELHSENNLLLVISLKEELIFVSKM